VAAADYALDGVEGTEALLAEVNRSLSGERPIA